MSLPASDARSHESRSIHENAAFAGMLAGVTHGVRRPIVPPRVEAAAQADGDGQVDNSKLVDSIMSAASSDVAAVSDATGTSEAATDDNSGGDKVESKSSDDAVATLDVALQERLVLVMSRLREATGRDVQSKEPNPDQGRADALPAQGREAPRPVVTWTQQSIRCALDVTVKAGHETLDAFTILQRVANEAPNDATPNIPVEPADASGRGQASVARIAQIARVEFVSQSATADEAPAVANPSPASVAPNAIASANTSSAGGQGFSEGRGHERGDRNGGYGATLAMSNLESVPLPMSEVPAAATTTSAQRADRIAAMDDAPARPLSQIVLSVDAGNGTTDRIQVALHGSSLRATIDAGDHQAARALQAHSDELVRSLTREGVEVESVRVRAATAAAAPVVTTTQRPSDASSHSRFERGAQWERQQQQQRSNEERRRQQRDQRGGKNS